MQREQNTSQKKISPEKKIGIVVSQYNNDITYPMRDAAIETLITAGVVHENIIIQEAP